MKTSLTATLVGLAGLAALTAGCGTAPAAHVTTSAAGKFRPLSLATTITTTAGTWGVTLVGGKAADYNNFWQVLVQPADTGTWKLVTPPGVASNGGMAIAPMKGNSLVAAFRPSQGLLFTPLAVTGNTGSSWSAGVIDAYLADEPSAFGGDPATSTLIALLTNGSVEEGTASGHWSVIGTERSLGGSASGCRLTRLTGVTLTSAGMPLAAGDCAKRGQAGIFAYSGGKWQLAGLPLPGAFSRDSVLVLALTTVEGRTLALIQAGTNVLAGELGHGGWSLSAPAALNGASVSSMSTGSSGQVGLVLTNGRGLLLTSITGSWQTLTSLPAHTQTLAIGPGSTVQAVVPDRSSASFYDYQQSSGAWAMKQKLKIPVQFGSSS